MSTAAFQPGLFDSLAPSLDERFEGVQRLALDETSWVDFAPGWVRGADVLFEQVVAARDWKQRMRRMYTQHLREPRLTAPWSAASGEPLAPPLLEAMRRALSRRYGVEFDSIGFNLYRDGRDSVAWHRDFLRKELKQPVIALVSLGERRRFLLRPVGGGASRPFLLGRGDLLVTGGDAQHRWEHSVPKVARAGPRVSLAFRYGLHPRAYAHKTVVEPE